jgi:hypothetical protein
MSAGAAAEDLNLSVADDQPLPTNSLVWRLVAYLAAEQLADTDDLATWFAQVKADRQELRNLKAFAEARV